MGALISFNLYTSNFDFQEGQYLGGNILGGGGGESHRQVKKTGVLDHQKFWKEAQIRALFLVTQKNNYSILPIKQLPYNPKSTNSENSDETTPFRSWPIFNLEASQPNLQEEPEN